MQKSAKIPELLSLRQVSQILKCHPNSLRLWDKKGILVPIRIGKRKLRRYRRDDILKLLVPDDTKSTELTYEKRYKMLVGQSPFSTQIFSSKGDTIMVNRAWEKLWGITWEKLGSYNILKDKQLVKLGIMSDIKRAFAGKAAVLPAVKYEPQKSKPGSTVAYRWVKAFIYPIKDEKGKVREVVLTHEDISEQKTSEEELQKYQERLEHAQKAGDIGIFEWNSRTKSVWLSGQGAKLLGFKKDVKKIKFNRLIKLTHPLDKVLLLQEIRSSVENHTDFESENRVVFPDKEIRWIRTRGHNYYDKNGKHTRMVGILYDITRRRQVEDSLRFKADASRLLSSTLNYEITLEKVANLAINTIADWCSVDILKDNQPHLVAVAHKDPAKVEWARKLRQANPVNLSDPVGLGYVLRTGNAQYYPNITEEVLAKNVRNKKELALVKKFGLTSLIIVPLKIKKKPIGAITFVATESGKHYTHTELQMAEQIASRASLAIENATLYNAVKNQGERLNNLLSNVPAVVWETWGKPDDAKQRTDFVSAHVERMLGYTLKEWLTTPNFWLRIVHPDDKERAAQEATKIFESGGVGVSRFRWVTRDGRELWVEAQSHVITDEKGKPVGMRGVTLDITEQMEQVKRKDEFISMASHELKTPVTSIKAFAQILEQLFKKHGDDRSVDYLQRMQAQINKLTNLISDLLDVSRIQQDKLQFNVEKFDFDPVIREAVTNLQAVFHSHKLQINGRTKKVIKGDKDRLGQVITNLVANAVKYSPGANRVEIRLTAKDNEVVVAVRDFGIGISKKHKDKIFDRFYRVSEDVDSRFPGLGIGLYISHQIVTRHGGRMWVKSKLNHGSTFYFSVPIKNGKKSKTTN